MRYSLVTSLILIGSVARAADYAGTYTGDNGRITVELQAAGGQYTGQIIRGSQKFPLKAAETSARPAIPANGRPAVGASS